MNKNNWILLGLSIAVLLGFVFFLSTSDKNSRYIKSPVFSGGNSKYPTTTANVATSTTKDPESPASTQKILSYGNVILRAGELAQFAHISLELVRVFDESRCPTGVTCIWAGTLKAEVRIVKGKGTSIHTIELGNSITTEGETIQFVSALPYPAEGKSILEGEYRLTFQVTRRTNVLVPNDPPASLACFTGGCSGEVCSDRTDVASNCMFRPEFACYKSTKCERQASGQCGWTETPELRACLRNPSVVE